jgi:uncharacterized protein YciI
VLTPESIEPDGDVNMIGSVLVFESETLEEVRKIVESDIYYTSGVVSSLLSCQFATLF